jgi:hypothetical protein
MKDGEIVVHQDPDAPSIFDAPKPELLPLLDGKGEVVEPEDELPADFPRNVRPARDGDGSLILTLRGKGAVLNFRDADGTIRSETTKTLTLKRLNGKRQRELLGAQGTDDYRPQVIATLAGISLGRARLLHDAMDATDISAVLRVAIFFTVPGPRTGP